MSYCIKYKLWHWLCLHVFYHIPSDIREESFAQWTDHTPTTGEAPHKCLQVLFAEATWVECKLKNLINISSHGAQQLPSFPPPPCLYPWKASGKNPFKILKGSSPMRWSLPWMLGLQFWFPSMDDWPKGKQHNHMLLCQQTWNLQFGACVKNQHEQSKLAHSNKKTTSEFDNLSKCDKKRFKAFITQDCDKEVKSQAVVSPPTSCSNSYSFPSLLSKGQWSRTYFVWQWPPTFLMSLLCLAFPTPYANMAAAISTGNLWFMMDLVKTFPYCCSDIFTTTDSNISQSDFLELSKRVKFPSPLILLWFSWCIYPKPNQVWWCLYPANCCWHRCKHLYNYWIDISSCHPKCC